MKRRSFRVATSTSSLHKIDVANCNRRCTISSQKCIRRFCLLLFGRAIRVPFVVVGWLEQQQKVPACQMLQCCQPNGWHMGWRFFRLERDRYIVLWPPIKSRFVAFKLWCSQPLSSSSNRAEKRISSHRPIINTNRTRRDVFVFSTSEPTPAISRLLCVKILPHISPPHLEIAQSGFVSIYNARLSLTEQRVTLLFANAHRAKQI